MGEDGHAPPKADPNAVPPPVPAGKDGLTGYGELMGDLRNMYGGDVSSVTDFDPNLSTLEKGAWYNHSLRDDYPPFVSPSASENNRVWQEMEVERMLDHIPAHEVYPTDLPDYHYWPQIQNELKHKPSVKSAEQTDEHHQDATNVPRFFRSGIPKTPLQSQDFYVPLKTDGKFDWRTNIAQNGYTASLFSASGWDRRFEVPLNQPMLPLHLAFMRQFCAPPIHFRLFEHPYAKRFSRHMSGSGFDRHAAFIFLYGGLLLYGSTKGSHWRLMHWDFEPYNYDIAFMKNNRDKGGFHGVV